MWMLLGLAAIAAAVVNIVMGSMGRETKYYIFASLALTAMTVCAFYSDSARRVLAEDWNGLTDIMPTMSKALWVCVIVSILVNGISLVKKKA